MQPTRRDIVRGTVMLAGWAAAPGCSPESAWISSAERPFGALAPWNVPVADLALHPQSNTYRDLLWNGSSDRPGNVNLMFEGYTYPVYMASAATGLFPVEIEHRSNLNGQTMPWNPSWRAATGSDGQVIVLDPATGREWDLWQVEFDGTTVRATNGNLVPGSYWTREIGFPPSRGAGIPYLAMLVRPAEIEQGVIPHALSMPIRNPDGASYVAPATKLERRNEVVGVPEGMRFALRMDDVEVDRWVADLPPELPSATRRAAAVIARALRDYGWFITDTTGSAHLQFEDRITAGRDWDRLGLGDLEVAGRSYPRDLLDGLMRPERIVALVPSDQYPPNLRARGEGGTDATG
jgi:hypothetical protein